MTGMKIALVGGDGREQGRFPAGVALLRVPAPKYTGNGRWESFLASLEHGQLDAVVLMARWIGHSAAGALKQAAARAGVRLVVVNGGTSMAVRAVEELLAHARGDSAPAEAPTSRAPLDGQRPPTIKPRGAAPRDRPSADPSPPSGPRPRPRRAARSA